MSGGRRAALVCAWTALTVAPSRGGSIYRADDLDVTVKTQEVKLPYFDKVLGLLDVHPGMTILDIGSGTGQLSYKAAEKLHGTGRVFAVEIDPRLVEYTKSEARRRGLANLQAVLVTKDGVDDFYGEHRYDLILAYDVFAYIHDRANYFQQMRKFLTAQGRLVVVNPQSSHYEFFREDIKDWPGFIAELKREPVGTPYGRSLRRPLRALLDAYPRTDGGRLERSVVFGLNRLLETSFFEHFAEGLRLDEKLSFSPEEKIYALWVLGRLRLAGLPRLRNIYELSHVEFGCVQRLNKLVLIQRFRPYLVRGGHSPYLSDALESRWYLEHDLTQAAFEDAGYRLEKKYDLIPYQAIWIFRSADGTSHKKY